MYDLFCVKSYDFLVRMLRVLFCKLRCYMLQVSTYVLLVRLKCNIPLDTMLQFRMLRVSSLRVLCCKLTCCKLGCCKLGCCK